jgi:hypothetical protein
MAFTKGINTYVTLNEADSYFDNRLDVNAWLNADNQMKEQALVTATLQMDELPWGGQSRKIDQNLAFPRAGVFRDSSRGLHANFSSYTFVTTDENENDLERDIRLLRRATYELALHLLTNEGLLDKTGDVQDIKVGSISLRKVYSASVLPNTIRKIVNPMLSGGGSRSWEGY